MNKFGAKQYLGIFKYERELDRMLSFGDLSTVGNHLSCASVFLDLGASFSPTLTSSHKAQRA